MTIALNMPFPQSTWQAQAQAKAAATFSKIPDEWRLDQHVIEDARTRRQLAGDFMIQLLDRETVRLVAHDSKELVSFIQKREFTSAQVIRAFCKTAAIAHQIVRLAGIPYHDD